MLKNQKGYTLKEIIVITAIFGVIALIAVFSLNNARRTTRDTIRVTDVIQIRDALELYFHDCNYYPTSIQPGQSISGVETCDGAVYLNVVPTDPKGLLYDYVPCVDNSGSVICNPDIQNPTGFRIRYILEGNTGGIPKGQRIASESGIFVE